MNTGYQLIGNVLCLKSSILNGAVGVLGIVTVNGQEAGGTESGILMREIPKRVVLVFKEAGKFVDSE